MRKGNPDSMRLFTESKSMFIEKGHALRKKREDMGMSVEDLSKKTGVSVRNILLIEGGLFKTREVKKALAILIYYLFSHLFFEKKE